MSLQRVRRTYLELTEPRAFRPSTRAAADSPELRVVDESGCAVARWRALYHGVGAPWHWHDRDTWDDATLAARLARDEVRILTFHVAEALAGFAELERHADGSVELVLFGLLREFTGRGLGAHFLGAAVDAAWTLGAARVWLHTCTLDAPQALPNYLARGFVKFDEEEYETVV